MSAVVADVARPVCVFGHGVVHERVYRHLLGEVETVSSALSKRGVRDSSAGTVTDDDVRVGVTAPELGTAAAVFDHAVFDDARNAVRRLEVEAAPESAGPLLARERYRFGFLGVGVDTDGRQLGRLRDL